MMPEFKSYIWGFSPDTMAINPIYLGGDSGDSWEEAMDKTKEAITYFEEHGYTVTNVAIDKVED